MKQLREINNFFVDTEVFIVDRNQENKEELENMVMMVKSSSFPIIKFWGKIGKWILNASRILEHQ